MMKTRIHQPSEKEIAEPPEWKSPPKGELLDDETLKKCLDYLMIDWTEKSPIADFYAQMRIAEYIESRYDQRTSETVTAFINRCLKGHKLPWPHHLVGEMCFAASRMKLFNTIPDLQKLVEYEEVDDDGHIDDKEFHEDITKALTELKEAEEEVANKMKEIFVHHTEYPEYTVMLKIIDNSLNDPKFVRETMKIFRDIAIEKLKMMDDAGL